LRIDRLYRPRVRPYKSNPEPDYPLAALWLGEIRCRAVLGGLINQYEQAV
jgi:hypothetical protein